MSLRLIFIGFAVIQGIASGAQYYVSTSESNLAAGTLAHPWRTVQKAANTVVAGDTVYLRAGSYHENVKVSNRHGTDTQRITFKNYPGEAPVIELPGVKPASGTTRALLWITNSDNITVQGIEFRNYATADDTVIVMGIYINGACGGIKLLQNKVHDIHQNNATPDNFDANAFGIAVYGDAATAVDGLVLDRNHVYNLRTGASESVSLNGNVTNFTVTNNVIHNNNNIGIDFIGFEGTNANPALDRARNGKCSGNIVYNIDSAYNPAYGGSFNANPPNDDNRSAAGIYVDGGANIIIERNLVYRSNFGIEVTSEHQGRNATGVIVRDNILHHNHVGGLSMGGASSNNGGTLNCKFTSNTLYRNDTSAYGGGQVGIQHFVSGCTIQDNIMVCNPATLQFVLSTSTDTTFAANAINWNLYSGATATDVDFIWANRDKSTFTAWKTASGQDANSSFTTMASTKIFNNAALNDFSLFATSPAINAGNPAFVVAPGELDFAGESRIVGGRVDIGAYEY